MIVFSAVFSSCIGWSIYGLDLVCDLVTQRL